MANILIKCNLSIQEISLICDDTFISLYSILIYVILKEKVNLIEKDSEQFITFFFTEKKLNI